MKLSLKQALISAVVVLAGVSLFMPIASSFAVAQPVQLGNPAQQTAPAPTPAPTPAPLPASTPTTPAASTEPTGTANDSGPDTEITAARCEGGSLGWILCPVIKLMQDFVGFLEGFIIEQLDMGPLQTGGRYENLYTAWSGFRDLANVFFIAIFVAIIFAQTLSLGLDTYSIKRMLPRLIIAAITIQFSYFIMQIGVDISNVVGNGIAGVFADVIKTGSNGGQAMSTTEALGALTLVGGVGALAAGTAIVGNMIVPFLLLILAGALSLIGVVLTVWLRVLILQFLVLLAPLAIVAWVMPNTEKWFEAWKSNVIKLLLMYPIIMFMISAGALATHITAITAETGNIPKLLSALAPIIVFLLIPAAIKASGSLMNLTGSLVMGRMNGYNKAVRSSALMQDAKEDFKNKAYLEYSDNDIKALSGFGAKSKGLTRRGMSRLATGNAFSSQRFGDSGTRKMAKGVEHARHLLEDDWKVFFRENAFGNPELLRIAQAGLVNHDDRHETVNSYGTKYKFKMNHHLAEAAVGQMVQQSGMVEFAELMDGEKSNMVNGKLEPHKQGTLRNNRNGLFDHEANQWKSKEIQSSILRALGPNAGAVLQKITHAVHLQGDRAYGDLQASGLANLGAGSGITATQQAVKWNAANSLNSMIQVINSNGLANSIQLDVAKSMKRELLAAEAEGKFQGITIEHKNNTFTVGQFLNEYVSNGGQVTAIQGDIKRDGLDQLIDLQVAEQTRLQSEIDATRKRRIAGEKPELGSH